MTDYEFEDIIASNLDYLNNRIKFAKELAKGVIGENLLKVDLCFSALLDRSMKLSRGFSQMIKDKNLTCAGALLRLQMDNCMRLCAIYIAEDEDAVISTIIDGGKISTHKDKQGKKMSDFYLKNQLQQYDDKFSVVYDNASGYVHFSNKAFYQSINPEEGNHISIRVGLENEDKVNSALIECVEAYLYFTDLFYKLINIAVDSKKRFDDKIPQEEV
ncbi:MAG: hypothetical protein GX660_03250 [Clostridiaceae bacterium]|nr:hypothetical protein [Clostridiaceae bacterium]